jgi:hypothetical protein
MLVIGLSIVLCSDNLKKIDEMPKDAKWPDIRHYQGTFLTTDKNITYFMPNPETNCADAPLPCLKPTSVFIKYNQEFFCK